jgi:putative flippase GtrA
MRFPRPLSTLGDAAKRFTDGARANGEHKLLTRYVLVGGVVGVPASIVTLQVMIWAYGALIGDYNRIALNAMWIINFEIGLTRNFLLHCAFTWRTEPTRRRLFHVHVAAVGAFFIDIIAFNVVVSMTGMILLAQVIGASSGFSCNFIYNRLRTFGPPKQVAEEAPAEGSIV